MELTLKTVNVNVAMSEETVCFDATIYADGKRAGIVCNRGCGGSNEYHWADRDLGAEIEAWAEEEVIVTKDPTDPEKVMFITFEKLDWKIGEALEAHETERWLKLKCQGHTVFRLNDRPDEWMFIQLPFSDLAKQRLRQMYGDNLGEIANERFV